MSEPPPEKPASEPPRKSRFRPWQRVIIRWSILITLLAIVFWITGCMERLFYYPDHNPTPTPEDFLLRRRILAGETLLALTDLDELLDDFP